MRESVLESSVESHQVLAGQWPSKSVKRSANARWDSTGDYKLLAAAEHLVRLVV